MSLTWCNGSFMTTVYHYSLRQIGTKQDIILTIALSDGSFMTTVYQQFPQAKCDKIGH